MTDADRAKEIKAQAQGTTLGYKVRPHSPRWNRIMLLLDEIISGSPPPPPPPPVSKYAPRAYNSTPSADARFCMSPEYGVRMEGMEFVDEKGIRYDGGGRDLGGRSKNQVAELKGANSMDGKEPCEEYTGPTDKQIGGAAGYPAASFEQ